MAIPLGPFLICLTLMIGCSPQQASQPANEASLKRYLTILTAPPTPWPRTPPRKTAPPTDGRIDRPRPHVIPGRLPLDMRVRAFPREPEQPWSPTLLALMTGRIVLDDGCFRLERRGVDRGPLVLFGHDARLARDAEGYVAIVSGNSRYRVGEMAAWSGPETIDAGWASVKALHRACGDGEVVSVGSPMSLRLFSLPDPAWVMDYARAKWLSYEQAWASVIACMSQEEDKGRMGLAVRDACIRQFNRG